MVIAGKHYDKGSFHNIFLGSHYRKEWTTPVRVSNFMLDTARGGLTVIKEGGSRQTNSLRLKDARGKEYVLRSIDKDFGNGLDEIYQGSFVSNIAKDQASLGHPFAAPAIAYMINATGIYHTNPVIVFVPVQSSLGEFSNKYGNQLYLFEERPDEDQSDVASFGNSKNVIGTDKLIEHLYEDNDNRVDQFAYAKARLFDMFIGDWGRHADQWRWAEFKNDDETIYRPIPRDRDQAFTQFDGVLPWIATSGFGASWLESFDGHLNKPKNFNQPAFQLDKLLLNELSEEEWIKAANELKAALTDQVIEQGMHQMPAEIFAISGNKIIGYLKQRRNELDEYARKYYDYLAHHPDILGSSKREVFDISRISDDETVVTVSPLKKDGTIGKAFYNRKFKDDETSELRIYGLAGEDVFRSSGHPHDGIKIRVVDPQGNDSIGFSKTGRNKISVGDEFEYDTTHQKKLDFFFLPFLSPKEYIAFANDPLDLFTRTGLKVSANLRYNTKPWRKDEYENIHFINANYGFLRQAFNMAYVGRFQKMVGNLDLMIKLRGDIPAQENFFGVGNESLNNDDTRRFYNVKSRRFYGGLGLSKVFNENHQLEITALYQSVKILSDINANSKNPELNDPSLFDGKRFAGMEACYKFAQINDDLFPTKGIRFNISGGFMQDLSNKDRNFSKFRSELAFYVPLSQSFSFASRVGGGILIGQADYYHLNILGGNENLRGFERERFYGENIFYNNNEIRWMRPTRNVIFNGRIGLLGFVDNGRVWQPGEISNAWHLGYGGGLILIPFNRVTLTGTYGRSKEGYQLTALASVFF